MIEINKMVNNYRNNIYPTIFWVAAERIGRKNSAGSTERVLARI